MTNNLPNGCHSSGEATSGSAHTENGHTHAEPNYDRSSGFSNPNGGAENSEDELYDLICVGFGPASLAIAIALHDRNIPSRVLFLEQQPHFAWHLGMLLPGTRMQISFIKDLATLRNPRSEFTFTNYLHRHNRLVNFINLGTFLPLREEYNDYMSWCASHFSDMVRYDCSVLSVAPSGALPVQQWEVRARRTSGQHIKPLRAKNVVIAIGGRASFPPSISPHHPRVLHSSQYSTALPSLLPDATAPYTIGIIGGGQSSAEIFNDLHTRYPAAKTSLHIRAHALKPSDDSPFVNEIFDPSQVDELFALPPHARDASIRGDRNTNYSVVRSTLIDALYDKMYLQRLRNPDKSVWQHHIHPLCEVVDVVGRDKVQLTLRNTRTGEERASEEEFDAVIFGTGYSRDAHDAMLKPAVGLMKNGRCGVERNYRVSFRKGAVAEGAGVFLQGCCEATHGLSDSLLSILAVRAGELVDSIFGAEPATGTRGGILPEVR